MSYQFDKFTERSRKVLLLAKEEAQASNSTSIGPEHLLLGLIREGDGVAFRVLSNMGVQLPKARAAVNYLASGETAMRGDSVLSEIGLDERGKKAIEVSVDEARHLNHVYIGTEHLLLGLIHEDEGNTIRVLEALGVNPEKVRAQIMQVITGSPSYNASRGGYKFTLDEDPSSLTTPPEFKPATEIQQPRSLEIAVRALADQPSEVDMLGFRDYAQALVDFIASEHTQKPLTICIDAPWGMGKSTLMGLVRTQLSNVDGSNKAPEQTTNASIKNTLLKLLSKGRGRKLISPSPTVWFNAWKYDQEESLWAALTLAILAELNRTLSVKKRLQLWWQLHRKRDSVDLLLHGFFRTLLNIVLILLLIAVVGLIIAWYGSGRVDPVAFASLLKENVRTAGAVAVLIAAATVLLSLYGQISKGLELAVGHYVRNPNYAQRIGFLNSFEGDFAKIVDAGTSGIQRPLVVFIDDLDRCDPIKTAEVIEAINLLLDAPNCVFVIGMDIRTVAASIEAKYKDHKEIHQIDDPGGPTLGYRFLEKIIQITFRIPRADTMSVQRFVAMTLATPNAAIAPDSHNAESQRPAFSIGEAMQAIEGSVPEIDEELLDTAKQEVLARTFDHLPVVNEAIRDAAPYLGYNPRKIKRFINTFRLQALIANRRNQIGDESQIGLIAKATLIANRWPEMVEALVADPEFCIKFNYAMSLQNALEQPQSPVTREEVMRQQSRLDQFTANPRSKRLLSAVDLGSLLRDLSISELETLSRFLLMSQTTVQPEEEPIRRDETTAVQGLNT